MLHYPVVIVGAGPTGLTLANLLRQYGVDVLLVERNLATVEEPRAVSIDDESLRTLQAAGVVERVMDDIVPGYGSIYYTPGRKQFAVVEPTETPYGYPRRNAFRQPLLEARLYEALVAGGAPTWLGWTLKTFTQSATGVRLQLADSAGARREVTCNYLVGCDGASSVIRNALAIPLEGSSFAKRWLIVDLENHVNTTRHTEVFCDVRRPCITLPGPNHTRRFEFELRPGEDDKDLLADEWIKALLAAHGADPASIVRRKAVYQFHALVASEWSVGRVFLAGDAAHLTPPFAGQGMNSGVRDAHNLAWKLAAVTLGRAGPALLRTYEEERRDHAWTMIQLALKMGRVMSPPNPFLGWLTQSGFRMLGLWPPTRDYVAQMRYKPKPRFKRGFLIPDGRPSRRTLVGRLLPQPWVQGADGQRMLLDDAIGPHCAVLVFTDRPGPDLAALDHPVWDRLGAVKIAVVPEGVIPQPVQHGVVVAVENGAAFREIAGGRRAKVLVLRADRYVAACFPLDDIDTGAAAVDALLAGTWIETAHARVDPGPAPQAPRTRSRTRETAERRVK